jgi:hypothetical protein
LYYSPRAGAAPDTAVPAGFEFPTVWL